VTLEGGRIPYIWPHEKLGIGTQCCGLTSNFYLAFLRSNVSPKLRLCNSSLVDLIAWRSIVLLSSGYMDNDRSQYLLHKFNELHIQ
ncbi:2656_t:CDS:2, partial [Ambispora leptoticha]